MGPCREEGQIKGCSDLSHFPLPPPVCWRESRRRGQRQVESAVLMGWSVLIIRSAWSAG